VKIDFQTRADQREAVASARPILVRISGIATLTGLKLERHGMNSAIDFVLTLILRLVAAVMAVIGVIEVALRRLLVDAGINGELQSAILIVVAIMLIIGALRLLGGVFGLLITVLLVLLIVSLLMPGLHIPTTAHI
jgi:hypothetical protein